MKSPYKKWLDLLCILLVCLAVLLSWALFRYEPVLRDEPPRVAVHTIGNDLGLW
ncbi:MAG: hypothetical protein ACI4OL_08940 [Gemmiger sp.]